MEEGPVEAAQITGHSLAVWTKHYARSVGKAQRDEARAPARAWLRREFGGESMMDVIAAARFLQASWTQETGFLVALDRLDARLDEAARRAAR